MEDSSRQRVLLSITCSIGGYRVSVPLWTLPARRRKHSPGSSSAAHGSQESQAPATTFDSPELRKLRAALPSGVPEQLAKCGEPVDAAFLERWLVARKNNISAAVADIVLHADWRRSFLGEGGVQPDEIAPDLAAGRAYFQGLSRDGCPILILVAARFASDGAPDPLAVKRLMCFLMDRLAPLADRRQNPLGQFRVLLDLAGALQGSVGTRVGGSDGDCRCSDTIFKSHVQSMRVHTSLCVPNSPTHPTPSPFQPRQV